MVISQHGIFPEQFHGACMSGLFRVFLRGGCRLCLCFLRGCQPVDCQLCRVVGAEVLHEENGGGSDTADGGQYLTDPEGTPVQAVHPQSLDTVKPYKAQIGSIPTESLVGLIFLFFSNLFVKNVVQDLTSAGHEWMRAKWSAPIRKYWKISEQMMVKYCDLAICDSVNIEKYIHECYDGKGIKGSSPKTTFIAYGADLTLSKLADDDEKLVSWYKEKGLTKKGYYLVVGRFVPENSFEVMIREFMKSKSKKDFAIITNVNEKFLNELEEKLHFKSDKRIKFVGTVYDQELLKKIRENAYTKKTAKKLIGSHISMNLIQPGGVATNMPNVNVTLGRNIAGRKSNDLRRASLPEEMAAIIAFLCSPAGRNINGQIITASACEDF